MKITIFGLTITSSWGNGHATPYRAIVRALAGLGHRIVFYEQDVEYYRWRRDFEHCDYCDVRLYEGWDGVRSEALAEAADSDVVINASYCPQGARIVDETLELARPLHVFYDLDTPVTLRNLAGGDLDYLRREQMPAFDLYLSWTGGASLAELEERWQVRRARPLHGGVDPDGYGRVEAHEEYRCDLSYMGTYAADRQEKLDRLFLEPSRRMPQASFVLAGTLYPWQWQWGGNVRRFDHVPPAEHPAFYSSARATLNLTRLDMARVGYCPSPRLFEAAMCRSPILSDDWPGLGSFLEPGEEILVVETADDVQLALGASDALLARIAERARERVLAEHTGRHRAQELLAYLEEAVSPRRVEQEAA